MAMSHQAECVTARVALFHARCRQKNGAASIMYPVKYREKRAAYRGRTRSGTPRRHPGTVGQAAGIEIARAAAPSRAP